MVSGAMLRHFSINGYISVFKMGTFLNSMRQNQLHQNMVTSET